MGRGRRQGDVTAIDWSSPRLVVLVGIPGSGKSTWARDMQKRWGCEVVSADRIRLELFSSLEEANRGGRENHAKVFRILHQRLRECLREGRPAIADATNLYRKSREPLLQIAREEGVPVEIVLWNNAPEARSRNRLRDASEVVPDEAMERMQRSLRGIERELRREGSLHTLT